MDQGSSSKCLVVAVNNILLRKKYDEMKIVFLPIFFCNVVLIPNKSVKINERHIEGDSSYYINPQYCCINRANTEVKENK